MKRNIYTLFICIIISIIFFPNLVKGQVKGLYGGGPFYFQGDTIIPYVKESGFNTVILWTLHIDSIGNIAYNDTKIIVNKEYIGKESWPAEVNNFKDQPSSVNWIEWSIGSGPGPDGELGDFDHIKNLIDKEGTGENSVLYQTFKLLKDLFPVVDAIVYDDESTFDNPSSLAFAKMLIDIGYKVSFVPYNNMDYWSELYQDIINYNPDKFGYVYLQTYDGGAYNEPASWNPAFEGTKVAVGIRSKYGDNCTEGNDPDEVTDIIDEWVDDVSGAWYWLFDDMIKCNDSYPIEEYYDALSNLVSIEDIPFNNEINIKVYPNPGYSNLYIDGINKNTSLKISDVLGNVIKTCKGDKQLNISNLPAGIYFLTVDNCHVYRFVKK